MSPERISRWMGRGILVLVFAGAAAWGYWIYLQHYAEAGLRYRTSAITRGEVVKAITASGQLNPVTMVEVGSQISGIIQQLLADFNSTVTKGQVIARIDPATYEANSIQAEGNLANARAALELAQMEERRAQSLRTDKLNTQAEYEAALAGLHQAEANVRIKEGALKSAQVDLARCTIYSPIDGLVLSRNVNVGQTVAASLSAPTLFVIANDLTKMQIEASVAEADIGQVESGQAVEFTVDAFPGQTFHGTVKQIRNAPKAEQNVVTYATIIEVNNPDLKLKPGMTANVSVIVARREQALRVPNAAFRFHPPDRAVVRTAAVDPGPDPDGQPAPEKGGKAHKKNPRKLERVVYVLAPAAGAASPGPVEGATGPLQAVSIRPGLNDSAFTEVLAGLKEGDVIVTGVAAGKGGAASALKLLAPSPRRP